MPNSIAEIQQKLRSLADSPEKVDLLNELSLELRNSDPKQALDAATAARRMAEASGYHRGLAYSLRNLATCLDLLSDFANALNHGYEALHLFEQQADKLGIYRTLNTIANIYYRLGDNARSLEKNIKLLEIAQDMDDPMIKAAALNNIGLVYMEMNDTDNALGYFQKSLDLYTASGRTESSANTMLNIGIIYRQKRQFGEALEFLDRSLVVQRQQQDRHGEALVWYNIGTVHFEKDEFAAAGESYQRCIELFRECGDRLMEADGLIIQARTRGHQGLTTAAFDQLQRAQELIDQTGSAKLLPALYQTYGELFERTEDFKRSLDYYKKFMDINDQQHSTQVDERLRGLRTSFEADQSRKEAELYRLKNIELVRANQELEQLNRLIHKGEEYRSKLMEQVATQSQELERLSQQDGLTGLYNRRHLDDALEREFARAKRYHVPLTIAMMDIDNFKLVNDAVSHHAGDEVLKIVAGILRANCRTVDLVARYGGEEFVMVFPETAVPQAAAVCERIRCAIEQFFWSRISSELRVTISIGLCDDLSVPHHEKLLSAADARMYQAKQQGRNRVIWQ